MSSSLQEHFFETDASQEKRQRRAAKAGNKNGNPVTLKSKILASIADPTQPYSSVFIAEAAAKVRRVNLETSNVTSTYDGPTAPVTCLAADEQDGQTIYAGSWDKLIYAWDVKSSKLLRTFAGHSDFVKALVWTRLGDCKILISGGADKKIIVWDATTGERLHTLQDPTTTMLAVQHLAIDPVLSTATSVILVSASSDPHIRRWKISRDHSEQLTEINPVTPGKERPTILEHETSVFKLQFDTYGDDVDLWTASADGTAKCLSRERKFTAEDVITHGDYVRGVVTTDRWVVTAGRDEDVKVWDRATGKLYSALEGHFDEITNLVLLKDPRGIHDRVCSVAIDGTIRVWPLEKGELDRVIEEIKAPKKEEVVEENEKLLTADEEAELAALMDDD